MKTTPITLNGTTYDLAFRKRNYAVDNTLRMTSTTRLRTPTHSMRSMC